MATSYVEHGTLEATIQTLQKVDDFIVQGIAGSATTAVTANPLAGGVAAFAAGEVYSDTDANKAIDGVIRTGVEKANEKVKGAVKTPLAIQIFTPFPF